MDVTDTPHATRKLLTTYASGRHTQYNSLLELTSCNRGRKSRARTSSVRRRAPGGRVRRRRTQAYGLALLYCAGNQCRQRGRFFWPIGRSDCWRVGPCRQSFSISATFSTPYHHSTTLTAVAALLGLTPDDVHARYQLIGHDLGLGRLAPEELCRRMLDGAPDRRRHPVNSSTRPSVPVCSAMTLRLPTQWNCKGAPA